MRNLSLFLVQFILFALALAFTALCVLFFLPIFGVFGLGAADAGISAMMILLRTLLCLLAAYAFFKASKSVKRRRLGWTAAIPGVMESEGGMAGAAGDDDSEWENGRHPDRNSPESW